MTRPLTLWVFIFFQAIFLLTASGRARVADEQELYFQTQSLVERGELSVPQAVEFGLFFGKRGNDGKAYAPYGPGTAFFAIPYYLGAKTLVSLYQVPPNSPQEFYLLSTITTLATTTLGALTATLFFLIVFELTGSSQRAWRWALLFGLGSYFWSYATCFYGEAMTTLCFTAFCYGFLPGASKLRRIFGLSAYLAAILCKAPLVIYAPALGFWAVFQSQTEQRLRVLVQVAVLTLVGGFVHMGWNYVRFTDVFDFGYNWSETIQGEPDGFANPFWTGIFGLTLSPGKGLIFFAPFTILSLFRARNMYRKNKGAALSVLALTLTGLLFYSKYVFWAGGYCVGPRHLLPILPFLALPALFKSDTDPSLLENLFLKRMFLALALLFQALLVQVSFLEDQAISRANRESAYYSWNQNAVGVPRNQYRLSYTPALTYPPRFWRGTTELLGISPEQAPGIGLDHWYLFLWKVKGSKNPGMKTGSELPTSWVAFILGLTVCAFVFSAFKIKSTFKGSVDVKIKPQQENQAS